GIDVERHPMIADPVTHPDADRSDLVFRLVPFGVTADDPHADPAVAPFALYAEPLQGGDDPFLEPPDMTAHVSPAGPAALIEIDHHIGDALARAVIGILPAAPAPVDRQPAGIEQVLGAGAGAGGVERGVLQQPHQLRRAAVADRRYALL